jgi:hypothetical protein
MRSSWGFLFSSSFERDLRRGRPSPRVLMRMRGRSALFCLLAACSSSVPRDEPEDPAALASMLESDVPLRREEAAQRMARLGLVVPGNADTLAIGAGIARALGERAPERMIWVAHHALRRGCLAREWKVVSDALAGQRLRLVEIYEPHEGSKFVRFLAKPGAYEDAAGGAHDLFFWIHSIQREGDWIVRGVYVGVHATFDAPFKQVAADGRYPRGTVLAQFLEMPEVARLASVFPVIEEVELSYGRIRVKDEETSPAGFHVNAGFALGAGGKGGGRGVAVTAESGLDPRETPGGRFAWDGFEPSETLGPLVLRGSSFWGAGGLRPTDE